MTTQNHTKEIYLSSEEVCAFLNITLRQLGKLREAQKIPYNKLTGRTIRYRKSDIDRLLAETYREAV